MTAVRPQPLTARSARIKQARRLARRVCRVRTRTFLVEGPQAVREALGVAGCPLELFATYDALQRHHDLAALAGARSVPVTLCDEQAVASLSGGVTPQGVVAVCRFVDVALDEAVRAATRLVVVAAHVRDPGNAGALLRCADAAGADAVVFAGSTVDPYNEKAVRASAGSLFHVPLVVTSSVPESLTSLSASGFTLLAADARSALSLDEVIDDATLRGKVCWIFGNEAWGIPDDEQRLADRAVAVPIYGRAESLNVATAAAVCLYATARAQRGPI